MAQMIKRKDGSYSKRGLWDNIRANKGSGKKPTAEMLKQEKKIKNENKMGGIKKMYGGTGTKKMMMYGGTKKKMMQKGGAKPDYLDMDKDGNKTESMKSAVASKKKMSKGGVKTTKKGTKPASKKVKSMGMGGSKMMKYQAGGFLEPPVYDLDA